MKLLKCIIFLLIASSTVVSADFGNQKPIAFLSSNPNQTWFYNLEDVVFSVTGSYDPDPGDYILQTKYFVNGSVMATVSYNQSAGRCFALHGGTKDTCYQLPSGSTTVTIGVQVMDNKGLWSNMVTKTYTIQEHKGRKYFITDHIGNVRATVNQDGNVLGYDDYYPFGKVMPTLSNNTANPNDNYKFTGHERDTEASLSIDYMNARTYDPITGMFMQIDPLSGQFPGWTPYHYVHNNPLRLVDPTGMAAEDCLPQCGDQLYKFTGWIYEIGRSIIPNKFTKSISVEKGVGDPDNLAAGVKVTHTQTMTSDVNGVTETSSTNIDGVVHLGDVTVESGTSGTSVNLDIESSGRIPGVDITVSDQGTDVLLQYNADVKNFDFEISGGSSDGGYVVGGAASYTKVNKSNGTYRRVETSVTGGGANIIQRLKNNVSRYLNNF